MAATARGGGHRTSRGCERFGDAKAVNPALRGSRITPGMPDPPRSGHANNKIGEKPQCGINIYNPLGNAALSTIAAAVPVVTLLVLIASGKVKAHIAAIIALILTNLIAIFIFTMPAGMSIRASLLGVVTGFFPIGWIVLNVIFLYQHHG